MADWEHPRRHKNKPRGAKSGETDPALVGHVVAVSDVDGVTVVCMGCKLERVYSWSRCDTAAAERPGTVASSVKLPQCGLCGFVLFLNVSEEVYIDDSNDFWTQFATMEHVAPRVAGDAGVEFVTTPPSDVPPLPPGEPAP